MGENTNIEWADSTINAQMGCNGCELASRGGSGTCYAETLTDRHAGQNGWPASFYEPKIFPERIAKACRWRDLTGIERPDKPWLSGRPRHIFLDDMGDTFTESLPLDWLAPHIPAMEVAPHVWMVLTKRPARMRKFFAQLGRVPRNFTLMTSVTNQASLPRVADLLDIPDCVRAISYEPALGPVRFDQVPVPNGGGVAFWDALTGFRGHGGGGWTSPNRISLVIVGGESGPGARPFDLTWARSVIAQCKAAGSKCFVKQLGAFTVSRDTSDWMGHHGYECATGDGLEQRWRIELRDRKGGDMEEWEPGLRVREFPEVTP